MAVIPLQSTRHSFAKVSLALAAVFLLSIFVRTFFTGPPEAWDAYEKWEFVKACLAGSCNPLTSHHTLRWGVNIPTALIHFLIGTSPATYYVTPLIFFGLAFTTLCYLSFRYYGAVLGLTAMALLFAEPLMFRPSTQLQPIVFGVAYLSFAMAVFLYWQRTSKPFAFYLAVLFVFCAYGAKEPYLYFVPGLAVYLGSRRGLGVVIRFFACLLFLYLVEWSLINLYSQEWLPLGRITATTRTHFPGGRTGIPFHFWHYFTMWKEVSPLNWLLCLGSLLGLITHWRKVKGLSPLNDLALLCGLMSLSFVLFNTFLIANWETGLTAQAPKSKYLAVIMPFAVVSSVGFLLNVYPRLSLSIFAQKMVAATSWVFLLITLLSEVGPKDKTFPRGHGYLYSIEGQYQVIASALDKGASVIAFPRHLRMIQGFVEPLCRFPLRNTPLSRYRSQLSRDNPPQWADCTWVYQPDDRNLFVPSPACQASILTQ